MSSHILIRQFSKTPKYQQISEYIIKAIGSGTLKKGSKLPSINQICSDNGLARETVVKAYGQLRQKGLVDSVQGKGYYVSSINTKTIDRVFVLFDTFTSYKETLFYSIKKAFGPNTILDIYFHHFNYEVFKNTIANCTGDYTYYIILPVIHSKVKQALNPIPEKKLYLLDIRPKSLTQQYVGIYQDFKNDVEETFTSIARKILRYSSFKLIFRNTATDLPKALEEGFINYCEQNDINYSVSYEAVDEHLKPGDAYLVIDDDDLVTIVENCRAKGYVLGSDIGVISYNDTSLKKVVGDGISVISTDFDQMGKGIVQMIRDNQRLSIRNNTTFVDRGSF